MDSLEERLQSEKKTEITPTRLKEKTDLTKFYKTSLYDSLERRNHVYSYCILSVILSFTLGLTLGVILTSTDRQIKKSNLGSEKFHTVSFTGSFKNKTDTDSLEARKSKNIVTENIFWGELIEDSLPQGYGENSAENWESYVSENEIVKLLPGCGRMQNRLAIFKDGTQACVRYRQNTDQIQGEIFSFYIARLLNLTNLAPSVVKVVDPKENLWKNVASEIGNSLWNSNRAVVLTKYIPSLEPALIPDIFKPSSRHLNRNDILDLIFKNKVNKHLVNLFVELAQWSDLIIFDYLIGNLDRMVNNLFNYQWNENIMNGPAHNLARKMDSGLLIFLDNESGLLHGYRLLKKYNAYHSLMLNNLCVFRKSTVASLKFLYENQCVGRKISEMFNKKNSAVVKDILPALPEKNAKILHERIGKVLDQIEKCSQSFR